LTVRRFAASDWSIEGFKEQNEHNSRRCHYKRRPASDPTRVKIWERKVKPVLPVLPERHHLIPNSDQTSWTLYPSGIMTGSRTGSENISVDTSGDESAHNSYGGD
jgi:hypothetical protein